jgi:hypothetical protein
MSQLVNATRSYNATTANGAVTHSTSLDPAVDLFFIAGASRRMPESDIIRMFEAAYAADKYIALKVLFWARDVRGGAGERRFFQVVMKHIITRYPDVADQLMVFVPEFGYWKDVFLIEKPNANNLDWVMRGLTERKDGLLAKWFPRKGPWFTAMHKHMKVTPKELRKMLVSMTNVVETLMCAQQWSSINYSHVPSIAGNRYRNAFGKRDGERYSEYIEKVNSGEEKINASSIFPYQLYQAVERGDNHQAVVAQWNALPDYMTGSTERILPVCDVSGSMSGLPMDISVSLGVYISERNKGIFKDAFITFSENPVMNYLKGDLIQRMNQLSRSSWGYSTNLLAVFNLILDSAVRESISQDEMPTKLLIISDMEFDVADSNHTNLDLIRDLYATCGYKMPEIIFWNVNGRAGNSPAQVRDKGIGLVSGCSPSILKSVLKGEIQSARQLMLDTIMVDRYKRIRID